MTLKNARTAAVCRTLRRSACALAVIALCGSAAAHNRPEPSFVLANAKLAGTWLVHVTTFNCSTLVENAPFTSYLTFGADGSIVETTANPAFLPGQRSAGHGYWERTGRNFYHMVSEAFIQFSSDARPPVPPFKRGHQRLEGGVEMTGRDTFTTDASITFFDESNAVTLAGCARAVGERME
jgi:hypothetical protein